MKGFKQCDKGHFYKEDISSCPYCPNTNQNSNASNTSAGDVGKTQINSPDQNKTQIFGSGNNATASTQIFGSANSKNKNLDKTFIQGMERNEDGVSFKSESPRASRKITGWIISFTIDPMGSDFRIFEGNNTIGRDPENTITIKQDPSISGKHVTILNKKGKFYIKDEMAANGTFINGDEIEVGKPSELKDGDEIKLGLNTIFLFKSATK